MSSRSFYDAEPFQGFTEFDEFGSLGEFDEFGSLDEFDEFGDYEEEEYDEAEAFDSGYEMESEAEMSRRRPMPRAGSARRPTGASGRRPPGASARRPPGASARRPTGGRRPAGARRPSGASGRRPPGARRPPGGRRPAGAGRAGSRRPSAPGGRASMRPQRPVRPARGSSRPPSTAPSQSPFPPPVVFSGWPPSMVPVYAGRVVHHHPYVEGADAPFQADEPFQSGAPSQPDAPPQGSGLVPAYLGGLIPVGRFGNWYRSGERVVILLDEDDTPLEEGADADDAPDADNGPAGYSEPDDQQEEEFSGRHPQRSRSIARVQDALNYIRGLRLPLNGILDRQTRSSLRNYQQQKGLDSSGQPDYETELAMARDVLSIQQNYEQEGPGIDPCVARCDENFNRCIKFSTSPLMCLAQRGTCLMGCPHQQRPPRPAPPPPRPTPRPTPPKCPARPMVRFGSRGPAVRELQARLNAKGATPPLAVDGIFGPLTNRAVRAFQRSRGLVADGIVGPFTWNALGC